MAKSKVGGTRAYIRGRIGSDVYSVGKNGKGARQQVVRSLAEQVSNPRTSSQMFGRMIMSTVMQTVSALKPIIDHSFDGIPTGQPSISEFIRTNYALVKADAIANPVSENSFGLNKYQEKGAKSGKYIISKGDVALPSAVSIIDNEGKITLTSATATVGGLKAALGLSADGYLTFVSFQTTGGVNFVRVQLTTNLADTTAISAVNVASLFTLDGNVTVTPTFADNAISFQLGQSSVASDCGTIVSEKIDGVWKHNTCALNYGSVHEFAADVALPTYPTGAAQFLNGGDI